MFIISLEYCDIFRVISLVLFSVIIQSITFISCIIEDVASCLSFP